VLYSGSGENSGLKLNRLLVMLNNAAGSVASQEGAAFVDIDTVPEDGISLNQGLKFILSDQSTSLRNLLEKEVDTVVDVLSRQIFRRAVSEAVVSLTPPRLPSLPFLPAFPEAPALDEVPLPILLPGSGSAPSLGLVTLKELTDVIAPKLNRDEEIFAIGLAEGAGEFMGEDIASIVKGEKLLSPKSILTVLGVLRSGVLQNIDLGSSEAAQRVLGFLENAFSFTQLFGGEDNKDITEAMATLTDGERQTFDAIVQQMTTRAIERLISRLSSIERIV
jgi:aarF domain-containing kinase